MYFFSFFFFFFFFFFDDQEVLNDLNGCRRIALGKTYSQFLVRKLII